MTDKDMTQFGGSMPANPDDLAKGLSNVGANLQAGSGGMPFLSLQKSGRYAIGSERLEPEQDSLWLVNPHSFMHGWACWVDGTLMDERMVDINQLPPPQSELPDYGDDWQQQIGFQMKCISGADTGLEVQYKGTSRGLRGAAKELINQIINQLQHDNVNYVPTIMLDVDSYHHKQYGEIFTPVLAVQSWGSMEGPTAESDTSAAKGSDDDAAGETGAPESAGSEQPEKPARRRRRRKA